MPDSDLGKDVAATRTVAHGLAELLNAGSLESIGTFPTKARLSAIAAVLRRAIVWSTRRGDGYQQ